ncbi:hypothetical protein HMPREF1548_00837 [Clostridium sp. KLE 1755]|nr:hypothetical protein HMPREF1548_00837 [Clostridium sp. KLE 1755]
MPKSIAKGDTGRILAVTVKVLNSYRHARTSGGEEWLRKI